jgi:hypothetical protein
MGRNCKFYVVAGTSVAKAHLVSGPCLSSARTTSAALASQAYCKAAASRRMNDTPYTDKLRTANNEPRISIGRSGLLAHAFLRQGLRHFDAVDRGRKDSTGVTRAFSGRIETARIDALEVGATAN